MALFLTVMLKCCFEEFRYTSLRIVSARAVSSSSGTRNPVVPSCINEEIPAAVVIIAGVPQAIASNATIPKDS